MEHCLVAFKMNQFSIQLVMCTVHTDLAFLQKVFIILNFNLPLLNYKYRTDINI